MNDYEKLHEELSAITNRLEGMSVPDADLDKLVYDGMELLKQAQDKAAERT